MRESGRRTTEDDDWLVARVPFLKALSADDCRRVLSRAILRRIPRGAAAWRHGAPSAEFLFVVRGRIKLVNATTEGRDAIVDLRTSGQLICSGASCLAAPYCCSAVAQADGVEVVAIPRQDLLSLLEASPASARAFLGELAACTITLCHRVEELTSGFVERRLATLLLRLADRLGEVRDDGTIWIPVALSRQDLADLSNAALESAIRTMSRFARNGIVETRPGGFLVRERAALEALTTIDGAR